jgi:uncharacterized protein YidB (DUF937 family)
MMHNLAWKSPNAVIQPLHAISKDPAGSVQASYTMSSLNDVIDAAFRRHTTAQASSSPRLKAALRLLLAPKSVEEGTHPDDTTIESDALQQLLGRFETSGYGDIVESWLSSGANKPIEPHQVAAALGSDKIEQLANRTGLAQDRLLRDVAMLLPTIVDALTPHLGLTRVGASPGR